MASLK
jgi:hypothetical protein